MDFPCRTDPLRLLYNAVFPGRNAAGEWANHTVLTAPASIISTAVRLPLLCSRLACKQDSIYLYYEQVRRKCCEILILVKNYCLFLIIMQ